MLCGGAPSGVPAPVASATTAARRSLRVDQGGPAAPVEGNVAESKVIFAHAEADSICRPLKDAGRGQGGFALEFFYPIMLVESASFSHLASSPFDAAFSVRILRISQVRMLQISPQSPASHFIGAVHYEKPLNRHVTIRDQGTLI